MHDDPVEHLTLQFLDWIAIRPRPYAEVMDAWRTSCPRLQVWESATAKGLVERQSGASLRDSMVFITAAGHAFLQAASDSGRNSLNGARDTGATR